jgi:FAD synthase
MLLKTATLLLNFFTTKNLLRRTKMTQATQERVLQNIFKTVGVDALSEPRMVEFVNTVSAPLAARMLAQIGLDKTAAQPFKLLDNGAGLGVVAAEIQKTVDKAVLAKSSIISADFSESTVEFVKKRIEKEGWVSTEARVVDAQVCGNDLLFRDANFQPGARKLDSQTTSSRI